MLGLQDDALDELEIANEAARAAYDHFDAAREALVGLCECRTQKGVRNARRQLSSALSQLFDFLWSPAACLNDATSTTPGDGAPTSQFAPVAPIETAHSTDFRSVRWFGIAYAFTANQARVVEALWQAWAQGTPDVGDETLLEAVDHDAPPRSLRDVFRDSPAWSVMVIPGATKGSHRLAS
jgi:hypothetical protein